jgi:hypothetical protein
MHASVCLFLDLLIHTVTGEKGEAITFWGHTATYSMSHVMFLYATLRDVMSCHLMFSVSCIV